MNHIDLFSGIGGFALAAHWAGFQTEVFCERDEFCQKVLHKHWPAAPIVDDIFRFDGTRHAGATLLTGGFPCQPYSCAGKKMGNEDDRALWPEMRRVIAEAKPHWVVAENVYGFVEMALDGVLSDLENQGYEVGTLVIPACAVNAPHRRDRVWIIAHHARQSDGEHHREPGKRQIQQSGIGHGENVVANPKIVGSESPWTEKPESQGTERSGGGRTFVANPDSQSQSRAAIARIKCDRGRLESSICRVDDGLPGRMDGHFDEEPSIPRVATGIPDRAARLRALGNAIVPQIANQIISNIAKLETSE